MRLPARLQLHPWAFEQAAAGKLQLESRMQDGYDHRWEGRGACVHPQRPASCRGSAVGPLTCPGSLAHSLPPTPLPPPRSYFTIATFMDDHLAFHAKHLLGA